MLIDWTDEFQQMLNRLDERGEKGDAQAARMVELVDAQLAYLGRLDGEPNDDTAMLRRVAQHRRYIIWRLSHQFEPGMAVRTIVWFDGGDRAVLAVLANNKAQMGDVFYDSVGTRADQLIDKYRAAHGEDKP